MSDACIDTGNEEDEPTLFIQKICTARKQYECCECGNAINSGDEYEYTKGLWDGEWMASKTCRICAAVRRDFCHSYIFGELWESMRETHGLGFDSIDLPDRDTPWDVPDLEWAARIKAEIERKAAQKRTWI